MPASRPLPSPPPGPRPGWISRTRDALPDNPTVRALIVSTLISSTGRTTFVSISVIYFNRVKGLSAQEVGLGMTVAAIAALLAGVPAGYVADRVGPKAFTVCLGIVQSVAVFGYLAVRGFWAFTLAASLLSFLDAALGASKGALVAGAVPAADRTRTRAYLRSVTNIGWVLGAVPAALALQHGTASGYELVIALNAVMGLAAALLNLRLPAVSGRPRPAQGPRLVVLRDRPYLAATVINALFCIHYSVIEVALPLWVVERTHAPAWIVTVLYTTNAVTVILLQVRYSRQADGVLGAARAQRRAGLLLLAACLLYAASTGVSAELAVAALVAGAFVHVLGELRQAAGSWVIAFELAPEGYQGQYQGMYGIGYSFASVVGPGLLTLVVIGLGRTGWLLIGLMFAAVGAAAPTAVDRAVARTPVGTRVLVDDQASS